MANLEQKQKLFAISCFWGLILDMIENRINAQS